MELQKIQGIFKKFNISGFIKIQNSKSKWVNYTALWKEISFSNNSEKSANIQLIKDKKKLSLSTKDISYENIEKIVSENLSFLEYTDLDDENIIPEITDNEDYSNCMFDIDSVSWDFLMKQINTVLNYNYSTNIVPESINYSLELEESFFINSFWSIKKQTKSVSGYSVELFYNSEDFQDVSYESRVSANLEEINNDFIEKIEKELIDKSSPKIPNIKSWKHTITLKNTVIAGFLEELMNSLSWESIRQKMSFINIDEIWKKIFSEQLNIISNTEKIGSAYNRKFDFEWIKSENIEIIKNWKLENIFLSYKNSLKLWMKSTWNPWFANLEIIWDYNKNYLENSSFLFTNLMAFHTIDSSTGKFALEWEWFEVNDWKIWNFIKSVSLSWDIKSLFSSIECLWDDILDNYCIFTPSITFKNQNIVV